MPGCAYSFEESAAIKRKRKPAPERSPLQLTERRIIRPAETALGVGLVTMMDLLRLKTIARLYGRGLPPDVDWEDLLQEALTRVLVGTRAVPDDVPAVAFIAGVMRSLRTDHRRRHLRAVRESLARANEGGRDVDLRDDAPLPDRVLGARQELAQVRRLFAGDPVVLGILDALGEGLEPEAIRQRLGLSPTAYDSARRRMRRALLRMGLTSCLDP